MMHNNFRLIMHTQKKAFFIHIVHVVWLKIVQSLCKSLGEKVYVKPPQNQRDELLLPITPPPLGKTACRELSQVEMGMIIALFWFFAKSLLLVLLQTALGQLLKTSSSGLQNVVTSTTSLDLGDPKNLPNTNGGTSGERLSAIESLPVTPNKALPYIGRQLRRNAKDDHCNLPALL